ncbi:MAG: hypothetical protein QM790_02645 [Nibricoccus sp.]
MSDASPKSGFFITAIAVIGGFVIFGLILVVAYLPNRPAAIAQGTKTPEERAAILRELRAKEVAGNSYGWVDQSKGVVHVPIERAMQLTLEEINRPPAK